MVDTQSTNEEQTTLEHDPQAEITALKARAYDLISAKEQIQTELNRINNQLSQLSAQLRKNQRQAG